MGKTSRAAKVAWLLLLGAGVAVGCASTESDHHGALADAGPESGTASSSGGADGSTGDDASSGRGDDGSSGAGSDGGSGGDGVSEAGVVGPGSYALNPPKQCDNQFSVPGCMQGVSTSTCGGVCSAQNACEGTKPGNPDIGFLCPRFILFGGEMTQAAKDDWGASPAFHYAVVGHDPDNTLDQNGTSSTRSCCQCYQLVFDTPNEAEATVNGNGASAVTVPGPLVVQAFNTSAGGGQNFDVYMGAGGFGGNNACAPNFTQQPSQSGDYLFTDFPTYGEGGNGGVKAATMPQCETNENLVTEATLSSSACQSQVMSYCDQIAATSATVASETTQSCLESNAPNTYYHLNWQVYAKKIECPTHLMQVTGCELAPEGLPAANPNVTTAAQAAADSSFLPGYTTTTMQDCCKPTCAWQDNVMSAGATVGEYNSFYSCNQQGVPVTE